MTSGSGCAPSSRTSPASWATRRRSPRPSPARSTSSRAAGVPPERWSDLLYQARGLTQEHTAQIRKLAGDGGSSIRRKNKMPYFLATLEQLVGLRPEPTRSSHGSARSS